MLKILKAIKKPVLIGEVSCNHNGKLQNAKKIIDTAVRYGVDLVKFQTYSGN